MGLERVCVEPGCSLCSDLLLKCAVVRWSCTAVARLLSTRAPMQALGWKQRGARAQPGFVPRRDAAEKCYRGQWSPRADHAACSPADSRLQMLWSTCEAVVQSRERTLRLVQAQRCRTRCRAAAGGAHGQQPRDAEEHSQTRGQPRHHPRASRPARRRARSRRSCRCWARRLASHQGRRALQTSASTLRPSSA